MSTRSKDLIRKWNRGDLSSAELIAHLGDKLQAARESIWIGERIRGYPTVFAVLELARRQRRHFSSLCDLIDSLRKWLDPERHEDLVRARLARWLEKGREVPWQTIRATSFGPRLSSVQQLHYLEVLESVDKQTPQKDGSDERFLPAPPELPAALASQFGNLAMFAVLPSDLPESVQPLARVMALRVFGGWSLERIAANDHRALADVAAAWVEARSWLSRATPDATSVGSLVYIPSPGDHILRAIKDAPQLLHVIEWRAFERVLAHILESLGYEVELQRGTKDGGVDIVAIRQLTDFGSHRYLIQAKRTRHRIGVEPVRELLFLKHEYRATKACLATTSSFTAGAWRLAKEHRWELELRDFNRLREWLDQIRPGV